MLAWCWAETLSGPASVVDGAGQHWESKESWVSSKEERLAGKSRDKANQGHGNGLFQERAKLGAIGKMTEESLGCSASREHCDVTVEPPVPPWGLLAINMGSADGCS